jgi:multicomponent Na+:H+ antiporter subunit G
MVGATEMSASWDVTTRGVLNLLAAAALLGGLFFMLVGALGVFRMPDAFHRMHAASKCTTLGITGMLAATCLHIAEAAVVSKALITIVFTFIAMPIGTHLLAKAAHRGRVTQWARTLSDEYAEDRAGE